MVRFFFTANLVFTSCFVGLAQSAPFNQELDDAALLLARDLCQCMGSVVDDLELHPRLVKLIYDMDAEGQVGAEKLFQNDLLNYSETEINQILMDAQKMENINFDRCDYLQEKEDGYDQIMLEEKIISYIEDFKSCELIAIFMRLGMRG